MPFLWSNRRDSLVSRVVHGVQPPDYVARGAADVKAKVGEWWKTVRDAPPGTGLG